MKMNALWAGHDYAYSRNRGRGRRYDPRIQRVKIIRTFKEKKLYNKNDTSYAMVRILNWDGTPSQDHQDEYKIEAYDIVDFWEDYWVEFETELIEAKERQEKWEREEAERRERLRKEREERELAEARRRELVQEKRNKIRQKLEEVGLADFQIDPYNAEYVTIREPELSRWIEEGRKVERLSL